MFTRSENCFIAAKLVLFCQRLAYVLGLVFARVLGLCSHVCLRKPVLFYMEFACCSCWEVPVL